MYWFWFFLFCAQPYFLLGGILGLFGKDAKQAADDITAGFAFIAIVVIIIALIIGAGYLIIQVFTQFKIIMS